MLVLFGMVKATHSTSHVSLLNSQIQDLGPTVVISEDIINF